MHEKKHDYAYRHFHEPEHGEWYNYLHRDGRISQTAKGNHFKGPFHFPWQEWYAWKQLKKTRSLAFFRDRTTNSTTETK